MAGIHPARPGHGHEVPAQSSFAKQATSNDPGDSFVEITEPSRSGSWQSIACDVIGASLDPLCPCATPPMQTNPNHRNTTYPILSPRFRNFGWIAVTGMFDHRPLFVFQASESRDLHWIPSPRLPCGITGSTFYSRVQSTSALLIMILIFKSLI